MRLRERIRRLLHRPRREPPSARELAARQRQLKTDVEMTRREAETMARFWGASR